MSDSERICSMREDAERVYAEELAADAAGHERDLTADELGTRPNRARSKILQMRLNPDEYQAILDEAGLRGIPASTLVRGWVVQRLRDGAHTDQATQVTEERVRELVRDEVARLARRAS